MSVLFCFGLGYTAAAYIAQHGAQFDRVAGTVRTPDKAARLNAEEVDGRTVEAIPFDDRQAVAAALETASLVIVSVPPGTDGDLVLARYADGIRRALQVAEIVYLSTIGVYGDHAGAWVDETTPCRPVSPRSRERLQAEREWQALGEVARKPVAILRLPGIYGPGRNALVNLMRGEARRIVKPGQVFNRIHVDDIARAIEAAYVRRANGIFNICDDEPAPNPDVIAFAADLLGVAPPAEQDFEAIKDTMSPMAKSFYAESKRVHNARMKEGLGVSLAYPTYREGLRALHDKKDFQPANPGR
jgi:nucleoside-diphosphate-sugar epimerase